MKKFWFLLLIVILSLAVRVLFFFAHTQHKDHAWLGFDSVQYHAVAVSVAQGNGFVNEDKTPQFYRLPGYPLFLGCGYKLFGGDVKLLRPGQEQTTGAIKKTLLVQTIVTSLIPVLVFVLSQILFPPAHTCAVLAATAAALHPGLINYSGILSTESPFLFLFLIFLILFCAGFGHRRARLMLVAGFVLGIASLIRPVGHYLIVLSIIMLLFAQAQRFKKMVFLFIAWMSVASIWLIRNYLLAGALFFHTLPGLHFLQYAAASVVMSTDHLDYFAARDKVFAVWHAQASQQQQALGRPLSEYERYVVAERLACRYLVCHPWIAIKNGIVQIARTCCTLYSMLFLYVPAGTVYPEDAGLWFKIKLYLMPQTLSPWLVYLVYAELLYGVWLVIGMLLLLAPFDTSVFAKGFDGHSQPSHKASAGTAGRTELFMLMPFVVLFVVITFAYGCARLRFAIEPLLMLLAAHGWFRSFGEKVLGSALVWLFFFSALSLLSALLTQQPGTACV